MIIVGTLNSGQAFSLLFFPTENDGLSDSQLVHEIDLLLNLTIVLVLGKRNEGLYVV